MIRHFATALVAGGMLCAPVSTAIAATLSGETVSITHLWPDTDTTYNNGGNGNFVVGSGVETTYWTTNTGISVDVADTTVTITAIGSHAFSSGASFNGFRIGDVLGTIDDFTSFSLISSTFGSDPIATFDASNLYMDFANVGSFLTGQTAVFSVAPVPLPAALPLLGGALSLLGFFGWRRKRMAAA